MRLALIGTDTDVGKTRVCVELALGLRALGRRVWLHKPISCGGWDGTNSEDVRVLGQYLGDGQPRASLFTRQFAEPCSPHLAASAAGVNVALRDLTAPAVALADQARDADVVLETAGGLLAPITTDRLTNADLLADVGWPVLLVTRPHLGTLNHTQLTVNEARRRGLRLLGLVVNHHAQVADSLAVRTAPDELSRLTGLPVLGVLPFAGQQPAWSLQSPRFAEAVLAAARADVTT